MAFYKPIYELVSHDVHWVRLNWRLLRILLKKWETTYMNDLQDKDSYTEIDIQTYEYFLMLLDFIEVRITVLHEYFDHYYETIPPLMDSAPDFFYGHFDYILRIVTDLKKEIESKHISLVKLRYMHNYVFFFYLEIVEGIHRFEVVSKELEKFAQSTNP